MAKTNLFETIKIVPFCFYPNLYVFFSSSGISTRCHLDSDSQSCPKVEFVVVNPTPELKKVAGIVVRPEYQSNPTCLNCPGAVGLLRQEAKK